MRHALMNRFQNRLFIDKKVPSNFTSASAYPSQFVQDIKDDLQNLLEEYARLQGQVARASKWRSAIFFPSLPTGSTSSLALQRPHSLQNSCRLCGNTLSAARMLAWTFEASRQVLS